MVEESEKKKISSRETAIDEVYSMLLTSQPRWQIQRIMKERYQVATRTIDRYIADASARLREELSRSRADRLAEAIAQRNVLYRATLKEKKYFTCLNILDSRDRMLGLFTSLEEAIALVEQAGYQVRPLTETEDTDPVGELFADVEGGEDSTPEGIAPEPAESLEANPE